MKYPKSSKQHFVGLSIKWKLSLAIVSLILVTAGITTTLVEQMFADRLRAELDDKGLSIAQNLAANSIEPILLDNPIKIQLLLNNVKATERDVLYAFILTPDKKPLAHTFADGFPRDLTDTNILPSQATQSIQLLDTEQGFIRDIAIPIIGGEAGTIHIGLTENRIREAIAQTSLSLLKISGLSILGAIIIAFFLGNRISTPLSQLAEIAEEIGHGNFSRRLPVTSTDEIGWLARIFNEMAEDLKKYLADRRHAADQLAFRNLILTTQQENSLDGILVLDDIGKVISYNSRFAMLWKLAPEILEQSNENTILKAIMGRLKEPHKFAEMTFDLAQRPEMEQQRDLATIDNKIFECYSAPMTGPFGKHQGRVWYARDITERVTAQQELIREKESLAITLRSIGDGVISTDNKGNIVLINKITEELTGWTQEEAVGRPLAEVFPIINERTREPRKNPVQKVLETGEIVLLANHTALIARDGTEYSIADSAAPILDEQAQIIGVVLVFRDVTTQQKIESEMIKTEKLDSLGILAGGIAHDFNNILTGIIGNISLARATLPKGAEKISPRLNEAEKACERARKLTQQLITFAKGGAPLKKETCIGGLLQDSAKFVLGGSNVVCHFDLPEDLWPAEMDEGQISQVISNLIINADQAMDAGGTITVKAANHHIDSNHEANLPAGPYVKISISDQGIGIEEKHLKRIFDPYFTTKTAGSGLGLASSFSIIQRHDGLIDVTSTPGVGTTFSLYLPAIIKQIKPAVEPSLKTIMGEGKILVMDDEDVVRDIIGEMLSALGYNAVLTRDGAEALELFKEAHASPEPFDAAILDLTIPGGMGGGEVIKELLIINPQTKAIVSSGYSTDPIMAAYTEYGFSGIISKPYKLQELSAVLDKMF